LTNKKTLKATLQELGMLAVLVYDLRVKNTLVIRILTRLRDSLLPHLISGKVFE